MQKHRVFWASVFANLLTLFLLPEIAHVQVTVSCPGGSGGIYTSITAAMAVLPNPNGPNTIRKRLLKSPQKVRNVY